MDNYLAKLFFALMMGFILISTLVLLLEAPDNFGHWNYSGPFSNLFSKPHEPLLAAMIICCITAILLLAIEPIS